MIHWTDVLTELQQGLSDAHYRMWLAPTMQVEGSDGLLIIACPNNFNLNQMEKRYRKPVEAAIKKLSDEPVEVRFIVQENIVPEDVPKKAAPLFDQLPAPSATPSGTGPKGPSQPTFPTSYTNGPSAPVVQLQLNPNNTFDQFVVGNTNRVAHAAALAVSDSPGLSYNPLFLYGGTGVGKTHLVQAIGNALVKRDASTHVMYFSIERFMNDFIDSIRFKNTPEFRKKYRSCNVLIVDDIQFISGKESTQEEFFHTFNELQASGSQIIICSDRPPRDIAALADRLSSRFEGGLTVDIAPPDFETRSAIIRAKADRLKLVLTPEIADYVASISLENIRALEGTMLKLQSYALSTNQTLTLLAVQSILGPAGTSTTSVPSQRLNPNELLKLICDTYNVTLKDLAGKKRTQELVTPRQIAMYLLRKDLDLNLQTIGQLLGGRDHTTIMHGIDKISTLVTTDETTKNALSTLRQAAVR